MSYADFGEVVYQLSFVHARDAAPFVDPAFGMFQRVPPDVVCQDFHVPGVRERERVSDRDADRIWLLTCGTAGARNPQRAWIVPEFFCVQLRQHPLLESFVHSGIPEEARFLRQQPFQQALVFDVGLAHGAQQFRTAVHSFCAQMFAHARGEKAFARFIEANSSSLFDQHANFAQLVLARPLHLSVAFAHRAPVVGFSLASTAWRRRALVLNVQPLPGPAARILHARLPWMTLETVPDLRLIDPTA